MALQNFRTLESAQALYHDVKNLRMTPFERYQLERAALSVISNLAEGAGKSGKERVRFFRIAMGSLREVQGILPVLENSTPVVQKANNLGGALYRLLKNPGPGA